MMHPWLHGIRMLRRTSWPCYMCMLLVAGLIMLHIQTRLNYVAAFARPATPSRRGPRELDIPDKCLLMQPQFQDSGISYRSSVAHDNLLVAPYFSKIENIVWINASRFNPNTNLMSKLNLMGKELQRVGAKLHHLKLPQPVTLKENEIIHLTDEAAFQRLNSYKHITILAMQWGAGEQFPRPHVFSWSFDPQLCSWLTTPACSSRYHLKFNHTCNTNMSLTRTAQYLEPRFINGEADRGFSVQPNIDESQKVDPAWFYTHAPDHLLYVILIRWGIVSGYGDVYSDKVSIFPYTCDTAQARRLVRDPNTFPTYGKIFVITQYFGRSFFHMMLEDIPRLAPFLSFLISNQNVFVHVPTRATYLTDTLELLGIHSSRLINGSVRADLIYLPRPTPCGSPRPLETQLLAELYAAHVIAPGKRNLVIFIRRSNNRYFKDEALVEAAVERAAVEFGLEYYLFRDDPTPGLTVAMAMFHRALLVVGPHGAGLSNMIYSQPGTFILEAICNPPVVNVCFMWTAHVLGHHYHGVPSRKGCLKYIDVDTEVLDVALKQYLKLATSPT